MSATPRPYLPPRLRPGLQTPGQLIRFLLHKGYPIPSPAALGKIGRQLVADLERDRVRGLLDKPYGSKQMSYDLRRLRRKGFIQRLGGTNNYVLTDEGRRLAFFLSKTYCRVVVPGIAQLDPALPAEVGKRSPLAVAWRHFDTEITTHIRAATIAALKVDLIRRSFNPLAELV